MSERVIDVIVPVYKGLPETRACLESLGQARNSIAYNLVLIDDQSPEPELSAYIKDVAEQSGADLIRHERNLGFAASINDGMSLHADRDVVLLNSDTEVHGDWLDRLMTCAYSDADIGTVTAFSNNGAICSYPVFMSGWDAQDLPVLSELDDIFRSVNAGCVEPIPTGVGYCMYIKREALKRVGDFDVENFGAGYGEENEFCMRMARLGWRNVLACDVFVLHKGGVSFGDASALQACATEKLRDVAPEFAPIAQRFIAEDPLAKVRRRVDEARVSSGSDELHRVFQERDYDMARRTRILRDESAELRKRIEDVQYQMQERVNEVRQHMEDRVNAVTEHAREDLHRQERQWQESNQRAYDKVASLESELESARVDAAAARAELESVYNSRSWRYTKFLRRQ